MNRLSFARLTQIVVALAIFSLVPRSIEAAPISLGSPLAGTALAGQVFELSVSFDLNGAAANVVGQEFYVDFAGLTLVGGSYQIGSVFTPFEADLITFDGDCAVIGCNDPGGNATPENRYLSLVSVFSPSAPTGPGVLFSMQFLATGSPWSLDLLGDTDYSLLSDPVLDGSIAPIPFTIVSGNPTVPLGTSIVGVNLTTTQPPTEPPASVPEPSTLLLTGMGFVALARFGTRRRQLSLDAPRT